MLGEFTSRAWADIREIKHDVMTLYGKRQTRGGLSFCYLLIEFLNKTLRKIG